MTLLLPSLQASLAAAGAQGLLPGATRESQISAFCDAYHVYSLSATTPTATLIPATVNVISLKLLLQASAAKNSVSFLDPANEWSLAFEQFWIAATFTPTGSVVTPTLTAARYVLAADLVSAWESNKNGLSSIVAAFNSIASVLHKFTISIQTTSGMII